MQYVHPYTEEAEEEKTTYVAGIISIWMKIAKL